MKLSLKRTTLVAAVLMSLCLLRTLFSEVIYDFLLEGHLIRISLFGDMMWCVSAMAIAFFFWGLWKYRDEIPQLEMKNFIVVFGCLFVVIILQIIAFFYAPIVNGIRYHYSLNVCTFLYTISLWWFYYLLKQNNNLETKLSNSITHHFAFVAMCIILISVLCLILSDCLWYFISSEDYKYWRGAARVIYGFAFVPFVIWLFGLFLQLFVSTEFCKESERIEFPKAYKLVSKISALISLVIVTIIFVGILLFYLNRASIYYSPIGDVLGYSLYLFLCFAPICWIINICLLKSQSQNSWLKQFNKWSLCALGVLTMALLLMIGLTFLYVSISENEKFLVIFGVLDLVVFGLLCLDVFIGWFLNTFIVFLSMNEFNLNKNIMRILKWVMLLVLLLFATLIIVDVIEALDKKSVTEALDKKSVTAEQVEVYKLKQGDLQYSDSIVINTLAVNTVYNINTKKYLHEDEMYHLLPFDVVSESRVVYVDTAYNRGYLNVVTGEIDIKAEYDYAWLYSEGVAAVVKDDKIGFIDKDNNVVIPFQYSMYASYAPYTYRFYNGYCKMTDEEGRCGLIDHSGAWVIEPKYQRIKKPVFDRYRKVKLDGKWGLLDENLKLILPIKYDHITVLDSMATRFEVTYEGMMYEIDRKGKLLSQLGYSYMHPFYEPKGRYGSYERTSGRYMQVWVRQEYEVDYNVENYKFSVEDNLEDCGLCFRTGIIDVLENKVVVPIEYCKIVFDNLPKEIDVKKSLVFKCIGPYIRSWWYAEKDTDWITLDGKKVRVKYE